MKDLGFEVYGGFRVKDVGFKIHSLLCWVPGIGCRVYDVGYRFEGCYKLAIWNDHKACRV